MQFSYSLFLFVSHHQWMLDCVTVLVMTQDKGRVARWSAFHWFFSLSTISSVWTKNLFFCHSPISSFKCFQIKDGNTLNIQLLSSTPLVIEFHVVLRRKFNDTQFQDLRWWFDHTTVRMWFVSRRGRSKVQKDSWKQTVWCEVYPQMPKFVPLPRGNRFQSTGRMFRNCCVSCWKFF